MKTANCENIVLMYICKYYSLIVADSDAIKISHFIPSFFLVSPISSGKKGVSSLFSHVSSHGREEIPFFPEESQP